MPVQLVLGRPSYQHMEGGVGGALRQSRIEATYVIYKHAYLSKSVKVTANAVQFVEYRGVFRPLEGETSRIARPAKN